jgi:WhiB family redox-sensing transcriptional regulator
VGAYPEAFRELNWAARAACKGMDTSIFFGYADTVAISGHGMPRAEREKLKEVRDICRGCPVRTECAVHALTYPEPFGIWGGLTRKERYQILRQRGAPRGRHAKAAP